MGGAAVSAALLLGIAIERARRSGLRSLFAVTPRENQATAGMARKAGFKLCRRSGIYAEFELPPDELRPPRERRVRRVRRGRARRLATTRRYG